MALRTRLSIWYHGPPRCMLPTNGFFNGGCPHDATWGCRALRKFLQKLHQLPLVEFGGARGDSNVAIPPVVQWRWSSALHDNWKHVQQWWFSYIRWCMICNVQCAITGGIIDDYGTMISPLWTVLTLTAQKSWRRQHEALAPCYGYHIFKNKSLESKSSPKQQRSNSRFINSSNKPQNFCRKQRLFFLQTWMESMFVDQFWCRDSHRLGATFPCPWYDEEVSDGYWLWMLRMKDTNYQPDPCWESSTNNGDTSF